MRVGLIVTGGVDRSGHERVIPALLWLIERLARRHELRVYALRYHREPCAYPLLGATVRDLGSPVGLWRQHAALVRALRADGPFDVLHAYWALPAGLVGAAAARRLRVPCVVTLDSGEFVDVPLAQYGLQRHTRQRMAVAATLRLASRLTVCSEYQRRLARLHGAEPDLIPIGVDRALFTPSPHPDGPPWRLVHVANLNPVKDQTTLLRALKIIVERRRDVHLDVVGLDTLEGSMQRLAATLGVAPYVTFHGFLPTDRLVPLCQRAHLHVLSSRHEAAGVVTLEAAACGVPTVGTAVGYVADWSPYRAVAVHPGDPDALASGVIELLQHPERRAAIAAAAHDWATRFDADWTADTFDGLYHELAVRSAG